MTDDIAPALTPEEWRDQLSPPAGLFGKGRYATEAEHHIAIAALDGGFTRHQLAALALYGQPFGFTQEDVETMRQIAKYLDTPNVAATEDGWALDNIANRLAALLPPRP